MTSKYGNDCQIWKRGDGSNDKNTHQLIMIKRYETINP